MVATRLDFARYFGSCLSSETARRGRKRSEAVGSGRIQEGREKEEKEVGSTEYKPDVLISFSRTGFFKREMAVLSK